MNKHHESMQWGFQLTDLLSNMHLMNLAHELISPWLCKQTERKLSKKNDIFKEDFNSLPKTDPSLKISYSNLLYWQCHISYVPQELTHFLELTISKEWEITNFFDDISFSESNTSQINNFLLPPALKAQI